MLKIGIETNGWYHHDDPLGSLKYIKSCGFEAIDFNLPAFFSTGKANKEGLYPNLFDLPIEEILPQFDALKEALAETNVQISQIHAPYPLWYEGNEVLNKYLQDVIEKSFAITQYLECPAVVIHPNQGKSREDEWNLNLAFYQNLIPVVKRYPRVKCCLENLILHKGPRILEGRLANAEEICRLTDLLNEESGGEHFGVCFDVGHANLTGRNLKEFVCELGNRLTCLHIHENNTQCDQHLAPYSCIVNKRDHICDWDGFVQGLREIGYTGVLSFETDNIFHVYPAAVHTEVLHLIFAIGHYWASTIDA